MFKATFSTILVISWRSVLLMAETGEYGENHRTVVRHRQTLSHNVVSSIPHYKRDSNGWEGGSGTIINGLFMGEALYIF
jgi:hypothetical protein